MVQNRSSWPWSVLGLEGKAPLREVKRAYAARLKEIDRSDPDAFGALRGAFDAAKGRATRDSAKRPRMAELAAEKAGVRAAPRRSEAPEQDQITDEPVPLAKPEPEPVPEPPPALEPEPEPANPVAPRAKRRNPPVPPKPSAKPWGIAAGTLDTLLDEDPVAAEDAFWTNLRKATKIWPWDTEALERLLSLDLAQDIARRRDVERLLFRNLKENVTNPETGYAQPIALLLERQFGWAADGVGLRRRLGYEPNFELMIHGHALSLPKTERPKAGTVVDQSHRWGWYKAGVFVILWLVSLQGQRISSAEDGIVQVIALFIFFWFLRWITRGLLMGAAWIGRVTRLSRPSRALFGRFFPETGKALDRNPKAREFAQFVLAAVLTALTFVVTWSGQP